MAIRLGFAKATSVGRGRGENYRAKKGTPLPVKGGDGELRGSQDDQLGKGIVDRGDS